MKYLLTVSGVRDAMLLQLCSQSAAGELLGKGRLKRHKQENSNSKCDTLVHLQSDTLLTAAGYRK
jgi:hypothetical protein